MSAVLALDIGGTKIAGALVGTDGDVSQSRSIATPAEQGAAAVLAAAVQLGRDVLDGQAPAAVGVGSAGVIGPTGTVTHATDALPGWAGTDLAGELRSAFGVEVGVLNDVHAHALGEATAGAGRDAQSMLLVAVGTGIGGGYTLEGRVVTGAHSVAGHVGHIGVAEAADVPCTCGRTGHLEGLASGPGILRAYRAAGGRAESTEQVATRAVGGEALARETITRCGRATGRVLGGLLNVLDPQVAVVTGGVAAIGDLWWAALREGVRCESMDAVTATPVVPAEAGVDAALLGAAAHVRGRLR